MIRFYLIFPNLVIISDKPSKEIQKKFGIKYEILTSIHEKENVDVIKTRLMRSYPNATIKEFFLKSKPPISEETRKLLSLKKLGKPRPDWVRQKISQSKKGISQFQGKKHTEETKRVMAMKKIGNDHAKDTIWAHNPRSDQETRVKDLKDIPEGFSKGRDYYSCEHGIYYLRQYTKSAARKR